MSYTNIIYLSVYVLVILYYALLGCWMFAYNFSPVTTRGEQEAKRRMVRAVGIFMFIWAFDYYICLPALLRSCDIMHPSYKITFLLQVMLYIPMLYVVIRAILQKWDNTIRDALIIGALFLIIIIWYLFTDWNSMLPIYVASVLCTIFVIGFIAKYAKDYRNYIDRLRSEYSETTSRDVLWSCWCFIGLSIQILIYLFYVHLWNFTLDIVYASLSIVNAAYICYCTRKQKPMDRDIVAVDIENTTESTIIDTALDDKTGDKAFYGIIEQKLESLCEKNKLFLEPDLTRESLCLRLSIGRTYLSMYLSSRGLTFYQYINSLRIEHAIKVMQENPEIPIREVSTLSGFRSQTTFRKVFQEIMGCLPSELNSKKEHPKQIKARKLKIHSQQDNQDSQESQA